MDDETLSARITRPVMAAARTGDRAVSLAAGLARKAGADHWHGAEIAARGCRRTEAGC